MLLSRLKLINFLGFCLRNSFVFLGIVGSIAVAQVAHDEQANTLILALEIDKYKVSDSLLAYQSDGHLFLPLCQLANELTILLNCDLAKQYVSGFVLKPERAFELSLKQKVALLNKTSLPYDAHLVRLEQDDFYVAAWLIEKWFPIKLELDLSRLTLTVDPLEPLPLQLRIARERAASALRANQAKDAPAEHHYPEYKLPYQLFSSPFIDQTLTWEKSGGAKSDVSSTTFIASDLLGMQSSLFFSKSQRVDNAEDVRFTLERNDHEARLLGPLHSRSVALGSIIVPGINNVSNSSSYGVGFSVSNLPLSRPTQFDKHTFQGELLPGWDVELYFNDALVGYQQSSPNGKYTFLDQPLIFGLNRFRLVFHGPQGQIRVEQHTFILNQALARPGEFLYTVATQKGKHKDARALAQFELGLNRTFSITGGTVLLPMSTLPNQDKPIYYSNFGLRTSLENFMLNFQSARSSQKGLLNSFTVNTEIASIALSLVHSRLTDGFVSELFLPSTDPIRSSTQLRFDSMVPVSEKMVLPATMQIQQDRYQSGGRNSTLIGRVTGFIDATTFTNELTANQLLGQKTITNTLQLSRNLTKGSLRGQINYGLLPKNGITALTLAADYPWKKGYLLGFNMTQAFTDTRQRNYGMTLNKNLGLYALRLTLGHNSPGGQTIGLQLFTSVGKDYRSGHWMFDNLSRTGTGIASIRVFVDKNLNGQYDGDDELVKGVGFTLNGSMLSSKTDEKGLVFIDRLPVHMPLELAVNVASLVDPQWFPKVPGINFVARPGRELVFDFPIVMASDVEGMVYLQDKQNRRAVGDVQLEVVNLKQEIVARSQSASDGYYLFSSVPPGEYFIRVSPKQLQQLNLQPIAAHALTITGKDGNVLRVPEFILSAD